MRIVENDDRKACNRQNIRVINVLINEHINWQDEDEDEECYYEYRTMMNQQPQIKAMTKTTWALIPSD